MYGRHTRTDEVHNHTIAHTLSATSKTPLHTGRNMAWTVFKDTSSNFVQKKTNRISLPVRRSWHLIQEHLEQTITWGFCKKEVHRPLNVYIHGFPDFASTRTNSELKQTASPHVLIQLNVATIQQSIIFRKNKATCFGKKWLTIIRPNYNNTKWDIFYHCISSVRSQPLKAKT